MVSNKNTALYILIGLSYISWVKFPIAGDEMYLADYLIRVLMLAIIWQERAVLFVKPNWPSFRFLFVFAIFFLGMFVTHQWLYHFQFTYDLEQYFYNPERYPLIENSILLIFDMSVGLMMVAVTEEFIFRYKLNEYLKGKNANLLSRYLISSILFALMHAPQGLVSIGETFLWGLIFFGFYQRTKSIHFVIVIHFVTNFLVFGLTTLERSF